MKYRKRSLFFSIFIQYILGGCTINHWKYVIYLYYINYNNIQCTIDYHQTIYILVSYFHILSRVSFWILLFSKDTFLPVTFHPVVDIFFYIFRILRTISFKTDSDANGSLSVKILTTFRVFIQNYMLYCAVIAIQRFTKSN